MTNDVTLGELLELQRSIPRGGSHFYIESSLLARMLAELVRIRTDEPPADSVLAPRRRTVVDCPDLNDSCRHSCTTVCLRLNREVPHE